jgi:hypothetical protein
VADSNFDIWRLQAQADIRGLIVAVKEGSPDIRKRAATALRALGATSSIPALQSLLVSEKDPALRSILITTLDYLFQQEIDEDDSTPEQENRTVHLIAQLNSDSPEQVIRAAQNLAELKEKLAVESLVVVFHNRSLRVDVRLAAAEALIKLESAPVEVTLLAALRNPDWHIRRNGAAVLGQLHADWAVSPLIAALRDEHDIVRRTAYAALKRIATPEALRAIEPPTLIVPATTPAETNAVTKPLASSATQTVETAVVAEPLPFDSLDIQPQSELVPTAQTDDIVFARLAEEKSEQPTTAAEVTTLDNAAQPTPVAQTLLVIDDPLPFDDEDTQPTTPPVLPDDVS